MSSSDDAKPVEHWLRDAPGGIAGLVRALRARESLTRAVRDALPAPAQPHCLGAEIKGDQLVVLVDSPTWATRVRFAAPDLLAATRRPVRQTLAGVTVRVMATHDTRPAGQRPGKRSLDPSSARLLADTAETIDDPELSAALLRLARHTRGH